MRKRSTMSEGLAPADIYIPDDNMLRRMAGAFEGGGLHYYLEQKECGERQPFVTCSERGCGRWRLRVPLELVSRRSFTDDWADDARKPLWVLTGARNCYSLLKAMARFVEDDTVIALHLWDLERVWPVLAEEFGTYEEAK